MPGNYKPNRPDGEPVTQAWLDEHNELLIDVVCMWTAEMNRHKAKEGEYPQAIRPVRYGFQFFRNTMTLYEDTKRGMKMLRPDLEFTDEMFLNGLAPLVLKWVNNYDSAFTLTLILYLATAIWRVEADDEYGDDLTDEELDEMQAAVFEGYATKLKAEW